MEKQKMEEKAMEENKKTNPDSERKQKLVSAILMAFVCILLMGGGTYAWFTMNNVARVKSLKLNVASEGNLYISKQNDFTTATKVSEVTWLDENDTDVKTLYPCTTDDGKTMYRPVYESDTVVSDKTKIESTDSDKESYYLEQSFWLYLDDGITGDGAVHSEYSVQLAKGTSSTSGSTTTYDGTYFKLADGVTATQHPEYCVRISFTPDETNATTSVYEPNYDKSNSGQEGVDFATTSIADYTAITAGHTQNDAGNFVDQSNNNTVLGDSKELFTITGGTPKMVTVRVWFEGTDLDCRNDIELKDIMAQLKFVATKKTTSN